MSSSEAILDREAERLRGAVFLGLQLNILLWGVLITQSYHYYRTYRKTDGRRLKGAVGVLFIVDALQSLFTSAGWHIVVHGLSNLPTQPNGLIANLIPFMDAFTASIVHFTYAQKIWTLLNYPYNYIYTAIVIALSCLQLTAGLGCTIFMISINLTFSEFGRIKIWASVWLFTAVANDILITSIMTWKLSASRTGVKKTDDIISKLIRLIVETGLATVIVQMLDIVLYLIWPLEPYHMVPAILAPKVYSNSMLALLNSRRPRGEYSDFCHACQNTTSIIIRASQTTEVTGDSEHSESSFPSLESLTSKNATISHGEPV